MSSENVWSSRVKGLLVGLAIGAAIVFWVVPMVVFEVLPRLLAKHWSKSGTSVETLRKCTPAFDGLDIESCEYTSVVVDRWSIIPAKANQMSEFYGSATLSEESANRLRSDGTWQTAVRAELPAILRRITSHAGDLVISQTMNEKFVTGEERAAVVMQLRGREVYFLSRSWDYPLD